MEFVTKLRTSEQGFWCSEIVLRIWSEDYCTIRVGNRPSELYSAVITQNNIITFRCDLDIVINYNVQFVVLENFLHRNALFKLATNVHKVFF